MRKKIGLKVFSSAQITQIHDASLCILEKLGIRVNHGEIIDLLANAGAVINKKNKIAYLSKNLVTDSIKLAKKKHIIFGRDRNKVARFGYQDQLFLSSGGQYLWITDIRRERRPGNLEDSKTAILLGDALKEINIVGAFILPAEIPSEVRDIHLYAELIKHTSKPCFTWINNGRTARYIIQMFRVLASGDAELKNKPITEAFVEPISPLKFSKEGLEVLIEFAKAGLPVGFGPMAMSMATAPATLAGTIAQENAEILAGITISQLLCPGLPVTYWGIPHIMDPGTGNISFGSPEQGIMAAAITQIAKWYGFPVGVNVGITDSNVPDIQDGLERGMTLLLGALAGADIFGHMGIVGADQGASLAELIVNNEMISYLKRMLKGFEVNKETLALEVIERVGIDGHFLVDPHTIKHFKEELWFPDIFNRNGWELWGEKGRDSVLERAIKRKEEILSEHQERSLNQSMSEQIEEIVKEADKDILGKELVLSKVGW